MNRYTLKYEPNSIIACQMIPDDDGGWIRYEDYEKLARDISLLRRALSKFNERYNGLRDRIASALEPVDTR